MLRITDTDRRTRHTSLPQSDSAYEPSLDGVAIPVDCEVAMDCGLNLLLVGPQRQTEYVIRTLLPAGTATAWQPGEPLTLLEGVSTLLLRNVDQLPLDEQRRLASWLEERSVTIQVVSTASAPLIEEVEEGRFRDDLYYRLNAIYVRC